MKSHTEVSTPLPAAPGCEEGVALLREKLLPMAIPKTTEGLNVLVNSLSGNTRILSIIASLKDGDDIKRRISDLDTSIHSQCRSIDDCCEAARKLIMEIGIPLEEEANFNAVAEVTAPVAVEPQLIPSTQPSCWERLKEKCSRALAPQS